jgi:hypothetical protein
MIITQYSIADIVQTNAKDAGLQPFIHGVRDQEGHGRRGNGSSNFIIVELDSEVPVGTENDLRGCTCSDSVPHRTHLELEVV